MKQIEKSWNRFRGWQDRLIPIDKNEKRAFYDDLADENMVRLGVVALIYMLLEVAYHIISRRGIVTVLGVPYLMIVIHMSVAAFALFYHKGRISLNGYGVQMFLAVYCTLLLYWSMRISAANADQTGSITLFVITMIVTTAMFYRRVLTTVVLTSALYLYFVLRMWGMGDMTRMLVESFFIYLLSLVIVGTVVYLRLKLYREKEALIKRTQLDQLTGLLNHASILRQLETEIGRSRQYGHGCSLMLVDVDCFKILNDTYGHHFGDKVMQQIADTLESLSRDMDALGRYDSDRFLLVLPELGVQQAKDFGEGLLKSVEMTVYENGARVTVSIGLVIFEGRETLKDLMDSLDQTVYRAKRNGRNRLEIVDGRHN